MATIHPDGWPSHLPVAFYDGLAELNRGEYFACHETLEALWIPEKRRVRELYQGVLQIAVGCFHLTQRSNWIGAVNKLDAGARRLEQALLDIERPRDIYGVAWAEFITEADRLQTHLRTLGSENVSHYDATRLPQVHYTRPAQRFQKPEGISSGGSEQVDIIDE